jgi:hypothetical protein
VDAQPWIIFDSITLDSWVNGPQYTYPDADFCLFAKYPKQDNLTYVLNSLNSTECISTIRWILADYFSQNRIDVFNKWPNSQQMYFICVNSLNGTFDFEPLLAKCSLTDDTGGTTLYAEFYQVQFIFEFIEDLFIFIGIPCACCLGLLLNILIIRAVHINKAKELKDDFYSYMSLNAVFNCLYCFIFLFYPINACVNSYTTLFCSSIRQSYFAQYYKIVVIAFLGETFKMCANISYILMNVNRYMLIGQEHVPLLENISKWDFKWVVGLTFIISALINVGYAFQYRLNNGTYYTFVMSMMYLDADHTYPDDYSLDRFLLLYIYTLVYFLINYMLFFIVNTWVEVTIVRKLHLELADKKKRLGGMGNKVNTVAVTPNAQPVSFRKRRKQQMEEGAEKRAFLMVVVNALINFFFRLPELLVLLAQSEPLGSNNVLFDFFNVLRTTTSLPTDVACFFYILTFSTNFLIYYLFNIKFKQSFSEWRHVKKRA